MQVTFLRSGNGLPLSKHFTPDSVKPYPLVKAVTSSSYGPSTLSELYELLKDKAADGECLLKGSLKRPLINESRAGKTNRTAYSDLLILDIDSLKLPGWFFSQQQTSNDVARAAEQIVRQLPRELHNASYVAHASSSFGLKDSKVSLHLFFKLNVPLPPSTIKLYLKNLNFECELVQEQVELSVNGQSLKFPIDVSIADNAHTCFIAPPTFADVADPFVSADDRFAFVEKANDSFDLARHLNEISPELVQQKELALKDALRTAAGGKKKPAKLKIVRIGNRNEEVLTNPDRMQILVADTSSLPYVRCNINGGDSNAYYFDVNNPRWMYNFKGEPNFEIEKADPDFFRSIPDLFGSEIDSGLKPPRPVVFRDFHTDTFHCGIFNEGKNQFDDQFPLRQIQKTNIEDFLLNHGALMPEFIPESEVVFDPTDTAKETNLSKAPYYVNTFRKSKYMQNALKLPGELTLGDTPRLQAQCPLIHTLLLHILGDGPSELERFINWLAYIFQTKRKSETAWVLGGTQGTGKQIFYSYVLRPLFGEQHVQVRKLQDIEENFNLYMRDALFLVVDEFHMGSANSSVTKIADKLKNQITERTLTIRAMRTNQFEAPSYTNFLFLTNRHDAVNLDTDDRRYNIAPRQETKLIEKHPEVLGNLSMIELELQDFANFLNSWAYNETLVRTPIDNVAKKDMRRNAMSVIEEFATAVKEGNIWYFLPILDISTENVFNPSQLIAAQRYIKSYIAEAQNEYTLANTATLNLLYSILTEEKISPVKFGKALSKFGMKQQRYRPINKGDAFPIDAHKICWQITEEQQQELMNTYYNELDEHAFRAANY